MTRLSALLAGVTLAPALSLGAILPRDGTPSSNCKSVRFNVYGSAQNRNFSGVDLTDLPALTLALQADTFPRYLVSGNQTLAATYCKPTTANANNAKIQVLFHSITGNRDTWSGQGGTELGFPAYKPEVYSWVRVFNGLGYATLALDRLGNGLSSHPDPVTVVQGPYETALYHDLFQQIRNGTSGLGVKYKTVYWVSNSYGSELGADSAANWPNDITAYVLTGFSKSVLPSLPGVALQNAAPAAVVMPARFAGLNPGYLTASIEQSRTNSFFGDPTVVDFEATVADLFYQREDTVSVGQFLSTYLGPPKAPGYKGRVLTLTGEQDQAFCGPGSSAINPRPSCGTLLKDTGSLFPAADYNWQSINKTGHAIMLHKTVPKTYGVAAAFLAGQSFKGNPPL